MRNAMTAVLVLGASMLAAARPQTPVGSLSLGEPTTLGEIDTDRIKGQPSRLAWSPDGKEIYVQMMEGQFGKPPSKLTHLVYKVQKGDRREVKAEPEWVTAYWTAKSGQASPDSSTFKIDLKSETRSQKTVSAPMGGDLARGGVGDPGGGTTSAGDALAAAYNQQMVPVNTMLLHGQIIGEYVNSVIVPGQTFGWGPPGSRVIAYSAHNSGRIVVMDESGKTQALDGTKDAVFPAWSPDGSHLAWLQKDGRKKYGLLIAKIS
jgi:hypothetical protein